MKVSFNSINSLTIPSYNRITSLKSISFEGKDTFKKSPEPCKEEKPITIKHKKTDYRSYIKRANIHLRHNILNMAYKNFQKAYIDLSKSMLKENLSLSKIKQTDEECKVAEKLSKECTKKAREYNDSSLIVRLFFLEKPKVPKDYNNYEKFEKNRQNLKKVMILSNIFKGLSSLYHKKGDEKKALNYQKASNDIFSCSEKGDIILERCAHGSDFIDDLYEE